MRRLRRIWRLWRLRKVSAEVMAADMIIRMVKSAAGGGNHEDR